jgi:hypothetical protein
LGFFLLVFTFFLDLDLDLDFFLLLFDLVFLFDFWEIFLCCLGLFNLAVLLRVIWVVFFFTFFLFRLNPVDFIC